MAIRKPIRKSNSNRYLCVKRGQAAFLPGYLPQRRRDTEINRGTSFGYGDEARFVEWLRLRFDRSGDVSWTKNSWGLKSFSICQSRRYLPDDSKVQKGILFHCSLHNKTDTICSETHCKYHLLRKVRSLKKAKCNNNRIPSNSPLKKGRTFALNNQL